MHSTLAMVGTLAVPAEVVVTESLATGRAHLPEAPLCRRWLAGSPLLPGQGTPITLNFASLEERVEVEPPAVPHESFGVEFSFAVGAPLFHGVLFLTITDN